MKSYLRYVVEFLVIITGVLLSFYLDDLRQLNDKKSYKDTLIEELLITSQEDLKQITKITEDLTKVQEYIDEFLNDLSDGAKDLSDDQIAEKYLFIVQKMSVSFFPQNGTFNQLISTGSLDLIDSKEFRDIINNKNFKKVWGDLKGEELVSSPIGFSKDDPNIDLIKKKMYLFSINFTNSDVLKNNFSNKITSSFKNISPFFNYMSYVLTTDLNGESII